MLHHFSGERAIQLLNTLASAARDAVMINDLHRHWLPWFFVRAVPWFWSHRVSRLDGAASVRQAYTAPELIDLASWRQHLAEYPAATSRFTVLYVGRFYRRKRVDILLRAAAILRRGVPDLEVRIVGNGPCNESWRQLSRDLNLDSNVTWLGDISRAQLAEEYNRCHVFCLPSVQEGFGIVLLEAMAAGKPIVAARAGAGPEVAPHATLVAPDNPEALAEALRKPGDPTPGLQWVEQFDAARVAARFLEAVTTGR